MHSVAELPAYSRVANKLLSQDERYSLIAYLASHPRAGDIIEGTGGVRKLRWRCGNRGKSGGVRIIYYYHNDQMPLYLLTLFTKGHKADLTGAERHHLACMVGMLVDIYKGRRL